MGNGYLASASLQTSTANQEVVPTKKQGWTNGYRLRKFSFDNETQECTVRINNETTALLKAGQGFEMSQDDAPIFSFVIIESGISFSWIASY